MKLIEYLRLQRANEEKNPPLVDEIRRRKYKETDGNSEAESKFLIFFHVDQALPLIGDGQ